MATLTVREARRRRHKRVRGKLSGTAERPRLVVTRSNRGIAAQLVDDTQGRTLVAASWLQVRKVFEGNKTEQAAEVGRILARNARKEGIEAVVFDGVHVEPTDESLAPYEHAPSEQVEHAHAAEQHVERHLEAEAARVAYLYHGRVKALAEAVRGGGLKF